MDTIDVGNGIINLNFESATQVELDIKELKIDYITDFDSLIIETDECLSYPCELTMQIVSNGGGVVIFEELELE